VKAALQTITTSDFASTENLDQEVKLIETHSLFGIAAGTRMVRKFPSGTSADPRTVNSDFAVFSDGSSILPPQPISANLWRAAPSSAGKTFEWEGYVLEVNEEAFSARLQAVKGVAEDCSEIAEFDLSEIPLGDRDLVKPGGIFRWVVGLESWGGTRQRYSRVVFRRLPAWTPRTLEASFFELKELVSGISWEDDGSTSG
jgi:hypothetical protein